MHKSILGLLMILLFTACKPKENIRDHQAKENTTLSDSLTWELQEIHKEGEINGFSVAIVNKERVLYANGIGYADLEAAAPYTENTLQNIASISKTFIGIALLKAQELGKLKLDDPINMHLPFEVKNPYFPEEAITIRHLATHTSTILDTDIYGEESYILKAGQNLLDTLSLDIPDEFNDPEKKISMSEFLENVLTENGKWYDEKGFLKNKPGVLFGYSNVAATLAAAVLEYATGEPFNTFTNKHILEPLGMESSGWSFDEVNFTQHSKMYSKPDKQLPFYSLITYPDGGMLTSSQDLGTYLVELIRGYSGTGTLLEKESYQTFFTEQLKAENFTERDEESPFNDEYNMGIFMGFSAKGFVGHTGGDPGVSSFMFFNAEKQTGRLLVINTDINNRKGFDQFISIWEKLGEYEDRLQ